MYQRMRSKKKAVWSLLFVLLLFGCLVSGIQSMAAETETGQTEVTDNYTITKTNGKYYCKDKVGKQVTGWVTVDGKRYFFHKKNGYALTGLKAIAGKYYIFKTTGELEDKVGFYNGKSQKYYITKDGSVATGLYTIGKKKYYFSKKGAMQSGKMIAINGNTYYFSKKGAMVTNRLIKLNGKIYHLEADGRVSKHTWVDGKYYDANGYYVKNAVTYSDNTKGQVTKNLLDGMALSKCTKLMVVAHPDDETLWGGAHLAQSGYLVVCLTNGKNTVRRNEFMEIMRRSGNVGLILTYPDAEGGYRSNWKKEKPSIASDLNTILKYKNWKHVVTHNPDGEYGHQHHKMTNQMVTQQFFKNYSSDTLYYFGTYYTPAKLAKVKNTLKTAGSTWVAKKKALFSVYQSQAYAFRDLGHMAPYEVWVKSTEWK